MLSLLLNHFVLMGLWKIDVYLISTLVYEIEIKSITIITFADLILCFKL